MGRRVRTLVDGMRAPGWYDLSWKGDLDSGQLAASGLYFVRFEAMGRVFRERLHLAALRHVRHRGAITRATVPPSARRVRLVTPGRR